MEQRIFEKQTRKSALVLTRGQAKRAKEREGERRAGRRVIDPARVSLGVVWECGGGCEEERLFAGELREEEGGRQVCVLE